MQVGLSGATITVGEDGWVTKTCSNALAQYRKMHKVGQQAYPIVRDLTRDSYQMERLAPIPVEDAEDVPAAMLTLLSRVWRYGWFEPHDENWAECLRRYLIANNAPAPLLLWLARVEERTADYPLCTIHGDATFENVMWHLPSNSCRLIDPLPSGGRIPAHDLVDRGKMLQSALGWENVRTGVHVPDSVRKSLEEHALSGLTDEFRDAAWFWCAVHLQRIRPYAPVQNGMMHDWISKKSALLMAEAGVA